MKNLNLYIGTLRSDNTKRSYRKDLESMFKHINKDESDITLADLLGWVNTMTENGNSTSTIARRIGTAKRYFSFLVDIDVVESNPANKLTPPQDYQQSGTNAYIRRHYQHDGVCYQCKG